MNTLDFRTATSPLAAMLRVALKDRRYYLTPEGSQHTQDQSGTINTWTRALATLIDPALYNGADYGLLTGNMVWSALWRRITDILDDASHMDVEWEGWTWACAQMGDLAEAWPVQRVPLIEEARNRPRIFL